MDASATEPDAAQAAAEPAGMVFSHTLTALALLVGLLVLVNHVLLPWLAATLSHRRIAIGSLGLTGLRSLVLNDEDGNALLHIKRLYVTVSPMWVLRLGPVGSAPTRPITITIDGADITPRRRRPKAADSEIAPDEVLHEIPDTPKPKPEPTRLRAALERVRQALLVVRHYALPFLTAFFGVEVRNTTVRISELDLEARIAHAQLRVDATLAYTDPQMRALASMIFEGPGDDFSAEMPHMRSKHMSLPSGRARILLHVSGIDASCLNKLVFRSRDSHTLKLHSPIGHYMEKESVQVSLNFAESTLDVQALLLLAAKAKQTSAPKPTRPRDGPPPAARLLEKLASVHMSLPVLHVTGNVPNSAFLLHGELRNLNFKLGNSDLSNFAHQSWFGACGIKGYQRHKLTRVPVLEEFRRIFYARIDLGDVSAHCVDNRTGLESLLLHVSDISTWLRTSYTPFGIFPAKTHNGAPKYFDLDPNEHAAACGITLGSVRGAVLAEHVVALASVLSQPGSPRRKAPKKPLVNIPRTGFLITIPRIVYVVHDDVSTMGGDGDVGIVLSAQNNSFALKPQYVERGMTAPTPLAFEAVSTFHVDDLDVYVSSREIDEVSHLDLFHMRDIELGTAAAAPVTIDNAFVPQISPEFHVDADAQIGLIEFDFWHPTVLALLMRLGSRVAPIRERTVHTVHPDHSLSRMSAPSSLIDADVHGPPDAPPPLLGRLPTWSIGFTIAQTNLYIGGSDPEYNQQTSRGLGIEFDAISMGFSRAAPRDAPRTPTARYFQPQDVTHARKALRLPPSTQTRVAHDTPGGACGYVTLNGMSVYPLVDISKASPTTNKGHVRGAWMGTDRPEARSQTDNKSVYSRSVWSFNSSFALCRVPQGTRKLRQLDPDSFVANMPHFGMVALVRPPEEPITVSLDCVALEKIRYRAQLMHLYCILVALGSVRRVAESMRPKNAPLSSLDDTARPVPPALPPRKATVQLRVHLAELQVSVVLPTTHDMLLVANGIDASVLGPVVRVSVDRTRGFVHSPREKGAWELMIELRSMLVTRGVSIDPTRVYVNGDCLQVHIPFGYYTHGIIEGVLVFFKASKQLVYQLVRGGKGSAIYPHVESAKRLPRVAVRLGVISFEAGDDAFESRLSLIFHIGRDEQLSRLEREALLSAYSSEKSPLSSPLAEFGSSHARLDEFNAASWIRRINSARLQEEVEECSHLSYILKQHVPNELHGNDGDLPINVVPRAHAPPLARFLMTQVGIDISPPTEFALKDTERWIHAQAGSPVDTPYTVLVPFHLRWHMSEAKITLRNYPVPLLSVPPLTIGQSMELANWSAEGDLCVAEQLGTKASIRYVPATVVPAVAGTEEVEHGMLVPKNAVAKKFFGQLHVKINTNATTVMCWGQSIQPAIQAMTRVIDSLTSPPNDPSPPLGPWDKLPLAMHAHVSLKFSGNVQMFLRGSRDPFAVDGAAAGWTMIWQSPTEIRIMFPNADNEVLQINSAGHLLAVPDISNLGSIGKELTTNQQTAAPGSAMLQRVDKLRPLHISKVAWRFRGNVRWGVGMLVERTCRDDTCTQSPPCRGLPFHRRCRFFGRRNHWEVVARTKDGVAALPPEQRGDTFIGWRSDFVHLSMSIESTGSHDARSKPGTGNHLYLTPAAWAHFMAWIRLFNSRLSLPVRQGPVFPQVTSAKKPKFGKHLATIKYRFKIAPLVASNMYHQMLKNDLCHGIRTVVGLRAHVDGMYLDIHQRMQETVYEHQGQVIHAFHKPLYELETDMRNMHMHVLGARFSEPWDPMPELTSERERYDLFGDLFQNARSGHDEPLYDVDDYVELGMVPMHDMPKVVAFEFLRLPHANFHRIMRQSDISRPNTAAAPHPESKFGDEPSHVCLMGQARKDNKEQTAALREHIVAAESNIEQLKQQLANHADHASHSTAQQLAQAEAECAAVKQHFRQVVPWAGAGLDEWMRFVDEWDNFVDHVFVRSPTVLVHSVIWGLLERFLSSVRLHSRMKTHLDASTQRTIFDLAQTNRSGNTSDTATSGDASGVMNDLYDAITTMASEGVPIPSNNESFGRPDDTLFAPDASIADIYAVHRSLIFACEQPQIILHSDLDTDATVVCSMNTVRSRTYKVCDSDRSAGKVRDMLHRNYLTADGLRCFHVNASEPGNVLPVPPTLAELYLDNETLADPASNQRVSEILPSMNAYVHHDKHNKMCPWDVSRPLVTAQGANSRQGTHLRDHTDLVELYSSRVTLRANSVQYAALYNIVTRVLMHRDPMEREHAKRLDTLLYSHVFEDPELVVQAVGKLQRSIHQLMNRQQIYRASYNKLNQHGRREYVRTQVDLYALFEELVLLHVAVGMAGNNRAKERHLAVQLQAYVQQIEWLMIRSHEENLFARLAFERVALSRLNLANLTSVTAASLGDVVARNAHPSAYFEDIITRYLTTDVVEHAPGKKDLFASVAMLMLPPVGGISVMDYFELHIHPVRLQVELRVGHQLMDYLFGSQRDSTTRKNKEKKAEHNSRNWLKRLYRSGSEHRSQTEADAESASSPVEAYDESESSDDDAEDRALESPVDAVLRPTRAMKNRGDDDMTHGIVLDSIVREMARRAAVNSAFIRVVMEPTRVCLSFKGDSDLVLTDLFDLDVHLPRLQYLNVVGAFGDIADLLKKDMIRIAWNNRTTLLKGVISTNSKKRAALRRLRNYRLSHYSKEEGLDPVHQLELLAAEGNHDTESDADSLASSTASGAHQHEESHVPRKSSRKFDIKRLVPDRILQLRRSERK